MEIIEYILNSDPFTLGFYLVSTIAVALLLYLLQKIQDIAHLRQENKYLRNEVEELDHQAQLIIKNDMELKLYQENVEDKLRKLSLISSLTSASVNILDKNQLIAQIDDPLINNLGFKKAAILTTQGEIKLNLNFSQEELATMKKVIENKLLLFRAISVLDYKNVSGDPNIKADLDSLKLTDFLLAPITVGTQIEYIFVIAQCTLPTGITEAEKVAFSIICTFLGQCLDNIKLFESLYYAGEEMETKIKEKTLQLRRSLDEEKRMSKMKSEFISSVSHELRTPLTSIKGFSSLLVREKFGKLPPEAKKRLEKIDENVNKLVDMVNTLLDIARIESRRMEIKIFPADIVQLIKDVGELLMPQMLNKNITFTTELPEKLNVMMDKNLMERVLINIINNAIKFTPANGKISVKCNTDGSKAVIAISDTGCGMSEIDKEKVFQEFYRASNPETASVIGTGLGLSLVKKIIDSHGQKIWVESELNKGTTFYFTLDLA